MQLGQAPGFHDFIAHELLPALLARYPLDPRAISLVGHSAAGTFVGYALAQPDSPFANFICLSPGVGICGNWMLNSGLKPPSGRAAPARVFAAIGGEELHNRFNIVAGIPQTQTYVDLLRKTGACDIEYHALDGDTHTTVFARAVAQALRVLMARGATTAV